MTADDDAPKGRVLGRYVLYDVIASGGMGSVHLGRLVGPVGFSRTVAIKKLHPHLASEAEFVAMFLDEARLAARIQHPNVVSTVDVVVEGREIFLVMEYVHGESVSKLVWSQVQGVKEPVPPSIACAIAAGVLHGLHAAHEARGEHGETLDIVHRDVSPQNVMVGIDGTARVFDFGVAKASVRLQSASDGKIKGKIAYMAPEQLRGRPVGRTADVYSASVVLWEMLTGRRLFHAENEAGLVEQVLTGLTEAPSQHVNNVPAGLDEIVEKGLARDASRRYATAEEMAIAIERVAPPASASEVGAWVRERARANLDGRTEQIARIEGATSRNGAPGLSAIFGTAAAKRRRWQAAAAVVGVVALVSIGLAASPAARSGAPQALGAPASVSPAASAPPPTLNPAVDVEDPPSPTPVISSLPLAPSSRPPPVSKRAPRPARRDCSPPYTRDSSGRVQWKVDCL